MTAARATTLVLWDVDHTLIENSGVSKENYALAFKLLTGREPENEPRTDGRTDTAIMADLLAVNGVSSNAFTVDRQFEVLADAGRRSEPRLRELGYALPGAAECLRRLASSPETSKRMLGSSWQLGSVAGLLRLDKSARTAA